MTGPAVLLFHGRGLISAFIRWQSRGDVSHAAILLPDGKTIIESWQGAGVRQRVVDSWEGIEAYSVPTLGPEGWREAVAFAQGQLGAKYDYLGVARFITRTRSGSDARWFCSELVFAAVQAGGVTLLDRIAPWAVAPGHLRLSPLLRACS